MTASFPIPVNEKERLSELLNYEILNTLVEMEFESIIKIVARTFNVPVAAINFLDADRVWMKARVGLDICSLDRGEAMCSYTVMDMQMMEVQDLRADDRFRHYSYIAGEPHYRYYAGVPLTTKKGYNIGALCIMDKEVRRLDEEDAAMLVSFGQSIVSQLEVRLENMELQQRNRVQQSIASALSHDIKGPLNNINMMLEIQEEMGGSVDDPEMKVANKLLRQSVGSTLTMLGNMIEWGKIQMGEERRPGTISLHRLADEALEEIYGCNTAKYNTLVNAVHPEAMVVADAGGLRFVLRNLLTNACKFTHNGCITISYDEMNGRNFVSVKDSGIGMPPDVVSRLNRFQRVTHTTGTHNEGGHGLGLSLVREYLSRQGKDLNFQSIMGMGTIVSFEA